MNDTSSADLISRAYKADWDDHTLALKATELAEHLQRSANEGMKSSEMRRAAFMSKLLQDEQGLALAVNLADRLPRIQHPEQAADIFRYLVDGYGIPQFMSSWDRFKLTMAYRLSESLPAPITKLALTEIKAISRTLVLPAEKSKLTKHLRKRIKAGYHPVVNLVGEAVLGETEAHRHLDHVIEILCNPLCDSVSVKLSSVFSQINHSAQEDSIRQVQERLRILYRAAQKQGIHHTDSSKNQAKFVCLDMEEFGDLHLSCEAFKRTLMEEEFMHLEAGIVLQAYLPESWEEQMKLSQWAKERVTQGGAPIYIRLVKGTALAMERVEAARSNQPEATFSGKEMTDANFKRMIQYGCMPDNAKYVRIGVASHNLFDLSYALLLRQKNDVVSQVDLEMSEGMATPIARVLVALAGGLKLYTPVVAREDHISALSYLVRRLNECTGDKHFLRNTLGVGTSSSAWEVQKRQFLKSVQMIREIPFASQRTQDRTKETNSVPSDDKAPFTNDAETDWTQPRHSEWLQQHLDAIAATTVKDIPLSIGGSDEFSQLWGIGRSPSNGGDIIYKFAYADHKQADQAIEIANEAQQRWIKHPISKRLQILRQVGQQLAKQRGLALATITQDVGKSPIEADREISDAIDFCRFYTQEFEQATFKDGVTRTPLGPVCVMAPWNAPYAHSAASIMAELLSGNVVIFKPDPQSVLVGRMLAEAFWGAGVPKEVLQFVPILPNQIGKKLITNEHLKGAILLNRYEMGQQFLDWRPNYKLQTLSAGNNTVIISATADLDQAVRELVLSAFAFSGQKDQSVGVAIVESSVYDHPSFFRKLRDAVGSLKVGPSMDPASVITPLIQEPAANDLVALTELDAGEEWLLKPEKPTDSPNLWSPGVRIGVKPGSWFHRTQCSVPVLGIIRAETLEEAIEIQNSTPMLLSAGLYSMDEREIATWKDRSIAGSLSINKPNIQKVNRQTQGLWKSSSIGSELRLGSLNGLVALNEWREDKLPTQTTRPNTKANQLLERLTGLLPDQAKRLRAAAGSQAKWWEEEFSAEQETGSIFGEKNTRRYLPLKRIILRAPATLTNDNIAIVILASKLASVELEISIESNRSWLSFCPEESITLVVEDEATFIGRLSQFSEHHYQVRYPNCPISTLQKAEEESVNIVDFPILANARLELLHYVNEQSVSEVIHRFGNIVTPPKRPSIS